MVKSGTKYDVNLTEGNKNGKIIKKISFLIAIDRSKPSASGAPKKLAPPKGFEAPPAAQQQQEVDLFGMDAPSHPTTVTSNTAPTNAGFNWDAPRPEPKADNSCIFLFVIKFIFKGNGLKQVLLINPLNLSLKLATVLLIGIKASNRQLQLQLSNLLVLTLLIFINNNHPQTNLVSLHNLWDKRPSTLAMPLNLLKIM